MGILDEVRVQVYFETLFGPETPITVKYTSLDFLLVRQEVGGVLSFEISILKENNFILYFCYWSGAAN